MSLLGGQDSLFVTPVPRDLEGLGIPPNLVMDIVLRRISLDATTDLQALSRTLKIPSLVVHAVFNNLRQQQFCEVKGMVGNDYRITLSATGRAHAAERFASASTPAQCLCRWHRIAKRSGRRRQKSRSLGKNCSRRSETWSSPTVCWTGSARR